jgi:hypothetical protein
MKVLSIVKNIKILHDIYRNNSLWLEPGDYKVLRDFDKNRYLIQTSDGITLISKSLTQVVS